MKRGYQMFSEKRKQSIEKDFQALIPFLQDKKEEIMIGLDKCSLEEALALKFLYTAMPLSDIASYPFELFYNYAKHGVFLWHNGQYSSQIPEDLFLNYILHYRINEEEISDSAQFFYEKLNKRVEGMTMKEAVLEANYWAAEEATYQAADERTVSPITVYRSAIGRCGEESTFLAAALRSIGIPARQVYAPRWSHCDDNHAWVEAWCDGEWVFCGACEPEEILNKGWFTNAASRAMMIHSRWFSNMTPEEEIIGCEGGVTILNQLPRYALTKKIKISVVDENALPVQGAKVNLEVLNYAELFPIVSMLTDESGTLELSVGLGSIQIQASKDGHTRGEIIDVRTTQACELVLKNTDQAKGWVDFDMIAPVDSSVNHDQLTEEQKILGAKRFKAASAKRQAKVEGFDAKFKKARGNSKEIRRFMSDEQSSEAAHLKEALLKLIRDKDHRDAQSDILLEHLKYAQPYEEDYDQEIFESYLLNPRIYNEPMTKYREFINGYYTQDEKETFQEQPYLIWEDINQRIGFYEEREFPSLMTLPVGALKIKSASQLSKKILFVAISRTIGVPARLNPIDLSMEYYKEGEFRPVIKENQQATLTIEASPDETWTYFQNWSIAKLKQGHYKSLDLSSEAWQEQQIRVSLEIGHYRILTANRMPNGNLSSKAFHFTLENGDHKEVLLSQREAKLSEMLIKIDISDFNLSLEDGTKVKASEITKDVQNLLIWLEESKEPTEHILNELVEKQDELNALQGNIIFIVKDKKALSDPNIARTLKALPKAQIYYDSFTENVNTLGRRMYVDPDKLPLIIVSKPGLTGVYATSGYNVGTGDMLLRILDMK